MATGSIARRGVIRAATAALLAGSAGRAWGAGQGPDPRAADELAGRRLALMRDRILAARVESVDPAFPHAFEREPIFRYSDATLGWVSAAVWKLGAEGRPKAIAATELRRSIRGRPGIAYEFASLTATPFSARSDEVDWSPSGTGFEFRPIPGAAPPEATAPARLRQVREIARRFAASEDANKAMTGLRLLPTPIDRYAPSKADRADGAVFLLTLGTNPELILLIESDGRSWSYAAGRLTGSGVVVLALDRAPVWEDRKSARRNDGSFRAFTVAAEIPGLGPDGNDLGASAPGVGDRPRP